MTDQTPPPAENFRSVDVQRTGPGAFRATNSRGGTFEFGNGSTDQFTPVELLLTAIAGCSAIDVDILTSRRSEPTAFDVTASGHKLRDELGNHMGPVTVNFTVEFPATPEGESAEAIVAEAIQKSHDRLCTVSRTVMLPTEVVSQLRGEDVAH